MNPTLEKLDQSEANTKRDVLDLKSRYLRASIESQTGERIPAPALTGDDVLSDIDTLEAHISALEGRLHLTAPRQPSHVSSTPAQKPVGAVSTVTKPQTLDEKVMAFHGCSTPDEVAAKVQRERYAKARANITKTK